MREAAIDDTIFERYVPSEIEVLLRVAHSLTRNHAEAVDLAQDTLLRAYRGIEGFDGRHPRAWLLTILRNTHIDRNRRRCPRAREPPQTCSLNFPALVVHQYVPAGMLDIVASPWSWVACKVRLHWALPDFSGSPAGSGRRLTAGCPRFRRIRLKSVSMVTSWAYVANARRSTASPVIS